MKSSRFYPASMTDCLERFGTESDGYYWKGCYPTWAGYVKVYRQHDYWVIFLVLNGQHFEESGRKWIGDKVLALQCNRLAQKAVAYLDDNDKEAIA
jgi:hypothetical protein